MVIDLYDYSFFKYKDYKINIKIGMLHKFLDKIIRNVNFTHIIFVYSSTIGLTSYSIGYYMENRKTNVKTEPLPKYMLDTKFLDFQRWKTAEDNSNQRIPLCISELDQFFSRE